MGRLAALAIICLNLVSCGRNDLTSFLEFLSEPVFGVPGGDYERDLSVTITAAAGLSLRYTVDSTAAVGDKASWTLYEGSPVTVDRSLRLRSYAFKDESNLSDIAAADFRIFAAVPVFSPLPGTFGAATPVSMTSPTAGAELRYTTDGTDPTETNGTLVANGSSVVLSSDTVLKARAYFSPRDPSAVAQGSYFVSIGTGAFDIGITLEMPGNHTYIFGGAAVDLTRGTDMTVTAAHALASPSYQWYLNGAAIPGENSVSVTLGNSGVLGILDVGAYALVLEILSNGYSYTEEIGFNVVP